MRFALALACALALVACGERQASKQDDAPAVEAESTALLIGPDGAAGINAALPMTVDDVRAAAPDFMVAAVQDQVEGDPFTAITLSVDGAEVFRVLPTADRGHVHAVITRSPRARGPTADIVGQTLFGVAPQEEVSFCLSQMVDGMAGFACSTGEDGRFWRAYKLPEGYEGPNDPFEDIDPDVLHDATLAEMRWIAPRT